MFDTTIARLVVLTHAVGHALYLAEWCTIEFFPVATKGDDDWVTLGGGGGSVREGICGTNLHIKDSITKKQTKDRMTKCQNVAEWGSGRKPIHHPRCEANAEYNIKTILCQVVVCAVKAVVRCSKHLSAPNVLVFFPNVRIFCMCRLHPFCIVLIFSPNVRIFCQ